VISRFNDNNLVSVLTADEVEDYAQYTENGWPVSDRNMKQRVLISEQRLFDGVLNTTEILSFAPRERPYQRCRNQKTSELGASVLLVISIGMREKPREQLSDEKTGESYDRHENSASAPDDHVDRSGYHAGESASSLC
jgi:hypothetical protein